MRQSDEPLLSEHLEELKEQFCHYLENVKTYVVEHPNDQFHELKNIFQNLEFYLNDQINVDEDLHRAGNQYPYSTVFSKLARMVNAAFFYEPEWMSRTGTILILDDNPNTSQSLMRRLAREGHMVLSATSESQAFEFLQSHAIEAILIDYQMFEEEIHHFLNKLEKYLDINYIPIIMIDAPERAEVMQQIIASGVADFLTKPVNPTLLKVRIHSVLEKKHAFMQRLKRSQEVLRMRQELEIAVQNLPDGFVMFDQDHHLVMSNDKFFEFYPHLKNLEKMSRAGLTFENLLESNIVAGIYQFEDEVTACKWKVEKQANFLLPTSQWEEYLTSGIALRVTTYRTPDGGCTLVAKDISKDKAQHRDLTFLAYHDSLTGLPNRKAFYQKLAQSMLNSRTSKSHLLAILFLDLDGFKVINDTYGHAKGDWVLNQVGQRLRRCIRGDDMLARFGGDEFCIILNHASNRTQVKMVASRILKLISKPYVQDHISLKIGVSIGIGVYSLRTKDSESIMKEADAAMYAVKQAGKGQFCFYDEILREDFKKTTVS